MVGVRNRSHPWTDNASAYFSRVILYYIVFISINCIFVIKSPILYHQDRLESINCNRIKIKDYLFLVVNFRGLGCYLFSLFRFINFVRLPLIFCRWGIFSALLANLSSNHSDEYANILGLSPIPAPALHRNIYNI